MFDFEISKIRVLNNKILLILDLLNFAHFPWPFVYCHSYLLPAPFQLIEREQVKPAILDPALFRS